MVRIQVGLLYIRFGMNIESSGFPEVKTKLKRILVRGSFILAGILLGLAVLLLITGIVFEQKARSIVLSEVQSILKPGYVIDADQITLRVFKNFPDMAVEFEQVNLHIKKTSDTIIYAKKILLGFSFFDLWSDTITIRELYCTNAQAHLVTNKYGKPVYDCFKTNATSSGSSQVQLKKVEFKQINVFWKDHKSMQQGDMFIEQFKSKGLFIAEEADLDFSAKGILKQFESTNLQLTPKSFELKSRVKKQNSHYTITHAVLNCAGVEFKLTGGIHYDTSITNVDISAKLKSNSISELFSWLPKASAETVKSYNVEGAVDLDINLKKQLQWQIDAVFNLKNARFENPKNNLTASRVNAKGALYWTPNLYKVELAHLNACVHSDSLSIQGVYTKSNKEELHLNVFADLHIEQWINAMPIDTLTTLNGQLKTQLSLHAMRINNTKPWATKSSAGKFVWRQGLVKFKHDTLNWNAISLDADWSGETLNINQFKGLRGKSDIMCKARIPNIFNALWNAHSIIEFDVEGHSNVMYTTDFESHSNATTSFFPLPFKGNCNLTCDKLIYNHNTAQDVDIYFNVAPEHLQGSLSAKLWNGKMNADFNMSPRNQTIQNVLQTRYSNINLEQALRENNNMGQNHITYQQVSGHITGTTTAQWQSNLKGIILDTGLMVSSKTYIQSGILSNYDPLMALSKFIHINELKRITFSDFNIDFSIAHNTLFLNKTELRNNALNIDLWGQQTFSDSILYHVRLSLTELLFNKIKNPLSKFKTREKTKSFGTALLISGTLNRPLVRWDREHESLNFQTAQPYENGIQNKVIHLLQRVKDSLKPIHSKPVNETLEFEMPKSKTKRNAMHRDSEQTEPADNGDDF